MKLLVLFGSRLLLVEKSRGVWIVPLRPFDYWKRSCLSLFSTCFRSHSNGQAQVLKLS